MKKQLLTSLSLIVIAVAAYAQTVTINGQTKNVVGTIVNVNQGDTSCLLTMKTDAGREFYEPAGFEVCDPKLKGQRVALTYAMANVQASSCQGDPNCKKSERIALVTSVKQLGSAQAAQSAPATASSQASFCTTNETVVFTCTTGKKMVSVCASRNASANAGYLQYRFGTPGQPLEMTLPESEVLPVKAAYGANDGYAGGGATWMRFRKGTYGYVVYSGIGRWGPNGETMEKQGVVVENNGKTIAHLKCNGRSKGELGPDWLAKAGYQRSDRQEFLIPE